MSFTYNERGLSYAGNETSVLVPCEVDGVEVRYLQPECFKNSCVEQIVLPSTLVEISAGAFQRCEQLQSIVIPSSVTHIGGAAFQGCTQLTEMTIPASVVDIGSYAFDECSHLQHITFNGQLQYIGAYAFSDTAIEKIKLPEGILQLGNYIFFNCQKLTSITLPSTVEVIGACAFAGCVSLQNIVLPSQTRILLDGAFEYCQQLQSVTFESIPTFIDETVFKDCSSIQFVKAPLLSDELVEIYDEKRHLFENNQEKLQQLSVQQQVFSAFFETTDRISFTKNEGPDYRLQTEPISNRHEAATDLFNKQQYEAVIACLRSKEDSDAQLLCAKSYTALGQRNAALQLYKNVSFKTELSVEQYCEVAQLLLEGTSLVDISTTDLHIIGKNYIHSF